MGGVQFLKLLICDFYFNINFWITPTSKKNLELRCCKEIYRGSL